MVFQSRWALSFLRGPLTRDQIGTLMAPRKQAAQSSSASPMPKLATATGGERPVLQPGIVELFAAPPSGAAADAAIVYQPQLLGEARAHFADAKSGIDEWQTCVLRVPLGDSMPAPAWDGADVESAPPDSLRNDPVASAQFASLPGELTRSKTFASLATQLKEHLYRNHRLTIYKAPAVKKTSQVGESEGDFRARLSHELKEQRDTAVEKLRQKYATRLASLEEQVRKAEQRVAKEKEQATQSGLSTMITLGTSLLAALSGRKMFSASNATRVGTSFRSATKAMKERQDIGHSQDTVEAYRERLSELEKQFETESTELAEQYDAENIQIEAVDLQPKKADLSVTRIAILWSA